MADRLTRERRSWNMSRIRGRNTRPERVVRQLLFSLDYRFRLQRKDLPGRPDIVLPKYRTVIFVHGCFWHRHRGCTFSYSPKSNTEFWSAKFSGNVKRDKVNQQKLRALGWTVLVVWECELENAERLKAKLNRIRAPRAKYRGKA